MTDDSFASVSFHLSNTGSIGAKTSSRLSPFTYTQLPLLDMFAGQVQRWQCKAFWSARRDQHELEAIQPGAHVLFLHVRHLRARLKYRP